MAQLYSGETTQPFAQIHLPAENAFWVDLTDVVPFGVSLPENGASIDLHVQMPAAMSP